MPRDVVESNGRASESLRSHLRRGLVYKHPARPRSVRIGMPVTCAAAGSSPNPSRESTSASPFDEQGNDDEVALGRC